MIELEIAQKQRLTLSPRMIQCMEVLQMTAQELLEYVEVSLQENPVLECQDFYDTPVEETGLQQELAWLESTDLQNKDYYCQDLAEDTNPLQRCADRSGQEELYDHLMTQLNELGLDGEIALCAKAFVASLDRNGRLEEELSDLARELGCSEEMAKQALLVIQSLEPAGVGARNLSECLRLQLLRQDPVDELAVRIVEGHLDALAKSRYGWLSQTLHTSLDRILGACALIRSLNPRPGLDFEADGEDTLYIIPDISVVDVHGHLEVLTNRRLFPTLKISSYYSRLLKESDDSQVQSYLTDKFRQAKWTIRAVDQRWNTLMACTKCLVEEQKGFFRGDIHNLKPLTLSDVARLVGLHESTVSRAIRGKYLQCAMGTYPMSYFFSRRLGPVSGNKVSSSDSAKALLKRFINSEDKHKPLSDEKLCQLMEEEGCILSRRTIAKYRDELGIPNTVARRKRK